MVLKYILAVILPPAAVFLETGISSTFVLNVLLTFLGMIPGIVHALWFLTKQKERVGTAS